MTIIIKIKCDNEAFHPTPDTEVSRILKKLSKQTEFMQLDKTTELPILDINGNKVGSFKII